MSVGLVYMRPLRLAGVCVESFSKESVMHAWSRLNEWVMRKSLSREVEIGYGLFDTSHDSLRYTACIELPMVVSAVEADELVRASLLGGAYMRTRFNGPVDEIGGTLEAMKEQLAGEGHVRIDSERPLVSVFLDVKSLRLSREVRSNLLIPVRGGEAANSRAA